MSVGRSNAAESDELHYCPRRAGCQSQSPARAGCSRCAHLALRRRADFPVAAEHEEVRRVGEETGADRRDYQVCMLLSLDGAEQQLCGANRPRQPTSRYGTQQTDAEQNDHSATRGNPGPADRDDPGAHATVHTTEAQRLTQLRGIAAITFVRAERERTQRDCDETRLTKQARGESIRSSRRTAGALSHCDRASAKAGGGDPFSPPRPPRENPLGSPAVVVGIEEGANEPPHRIAEEADSERGEERLTHRLCSYGAQSALCAGDAAARAKAPPQREPANERVHDGICDKAP